MSGARRATDKVSTDRALELVCTLATEQALAGGDEVVIESVANAVLKLRELKIEATGKHQILEMVDVGAYCAMNPEDGGS